MSLIHLPTRRPRPVRKHRAEDRIAELQAQHAAEMANLRRENRALIKSLAAADEFFQQQDRNMTALEGELATERRERAAADAEVAARGRWINDLERRLEEVTQRIEVRVKAEHVIAKTQEINVTTLREAAAAGRLGPVTDPGHVRPSWARTP
jgi:chromosome segregation ATPase